MPELPEIELTKQYVDSTSLKKKIVKVDFPSTSLLQSPKAQFEKALKGNKIEKTERLGKYLFLKCGEAWLVLHFGMTGKVEYYQNQEPPKYSHMILTFEDDYKLAYSCKRKLGKLYLTESVEKFKEEHDLGNDALDFSEKEIFELLEKKTGAIKGVLMDQHAIAGIGNVYTDEMLYQVGIHPKSKANKLSEKEKKALFKQIEKVLNTAIKVGGKRSEFPDHYMIKHRKEGDECPNGKGKVEMIKVSGRSTYFCPSSQEEK